MLSPNGSIANLFVTRKSLVTRNSGSGFSVPFRCGRQDWLDRQANKKPALEGAGSGSNEIFWPRSAARRPRDYFCTFA
jgi:hypothetical protein